MSTLAKTGQRNVVSPYLLTMRDALAESVNRAKARFDIGDLKVEIQAAGDSLWAIVRRPGRGGVALRAAYLAGEFGYARLKAEPDEQARIGVTSALGAHVISFKAGDAPLEHLRMTVHFTPTTSMAIPFAPRDLYPLDRNDDPLGAKGGVEARQRGLNAGLVYLRFDEPDFGDVLYFQNLTALNDYYRATKTKPDGVVGGDWPELGYLLPTPEQTEPRGPRLSYPMRSWCSGKIRRPMSGSPPVASCRCSAWSIK
jgi:hypothetical protein